MKCNIYMKICVVLFSNKAYINHIFDIIKKLRSIGKYKGDIVYFYTDDLKYYNFNKLKEYNIILKHFDDIKFTKSTLELLKKTWRADKLIQYHKCYLFNIFFKQWDKILYLDSKTKVLKDINSFFDINCDNKLIANSDTYPTNKWKLDVQFEKDLNKDLYKKLEEEFNLNCDYFQTGVMLFDTNIINNNTFNDLINMINKYPISRTNEQGIMNLYFNCDKKIYVPIHIFNKENIIYYDFFFRKPHHKNKYILVSYWQK